MKREEAINLVKQVLPCLNIDEKIREGFKTLIPELAESEDERIRKWIFDLINNMSFENLTASERAKNEEWRKKVLAYLEKQKYNRMKPVYDNQESFESALEKAWKEYNDSGSRTVDSCEDDYIECAHAKGFREGYLFGIEKQKVNPEEPKIAFGDWGDKEKKEAIITCLKYMRFIKKITNQEYDDLTKWLDNNLVSNVLEKDEHLRLEDEGWDDEYMINTVIGRYNLHAEVAKKHGDTHDYNLSKSMENWLRNVVRPLLEKQKEQKPAEWSEEDVKRLYSIGTQIGFLMGKYPECQKDIDWLHALAEKMGFHKCKTGEVTTEWKEEDIDDKMLSKSKQEWSEEDEKMFREALTDIIYAKHELNKKGCEGLAKSALNAFNWLNTRFKSLRPQPSWKPSEEQIGALNYAYCELFKREDVGYNILSPLQKLLDDLKKLM